MFQVFTVKKDMSFIARFKVRIIQLISLLNWYAIKASTALLGRRARWTVLAILSEQLIPVVETESRYGIIKFFCPGEWPMLRSSMTKEPETYKWIETFNDGDVLYDIGANVGVYSIYAARKGLRVFSFEPSAINYFVLMRNIEVNNLDERVTALNIAVNDQSKLDNLYMSHTVVGGAQHTFGRPQSENDFIKDYGSHNKFKQSIIGYSLDDFVENLEVEFPNHIKIDTDGNEKRIITGAKRIIHDPKLKSISIELRGRDEKMREDVINLLQEAGLNLFDDSKGNYIFKR